MLSDNIKNLRKAKNLSQEELAIRLNVVRQTISKWENGFSVPDSEMLIKIAEVLDTSVNILLDETVAPEGATDLKAIADKLAATNEQLARLIESRRRIWRTVFITAFVVTTCLMLVFLVKYLSFQMAISQANESLAIIGGADGPTAIAVAGPTYKIIPLVLSLLFAAASLVGICKTGRK